MSETFVKEERSALAVYLHYNRDVGKLSKFGDIVYHSRKLRYVVLYVPADEFTEILSLLEKERFVKEILPSYIKDLDTDFVGNLYRIEKESVII